MNESQSATVLLLTADLATSSKVSGAAAREGVTLAVALNAVSLTEKAVESRPALVILDLGTPRLVVADVVARLQALAAPPQRIVAFGPHVHEGLLQAARTPVAPRSCRADSSTRKSTSCCKRPMAGVWISQAVSHGARFRRAFLPGLTRRYPRHCRPFHPRARRRRSWPRQRRRSRSAAGRTDRSVLRRRLRPSRCHPRRSATRSR